MTKPEKRRSVRIKTRFEALVASDHTHGAGVLADISYTGAHVAQTTFQPKVGTEVRLFVFLQPVNPFELVGTVVRHTADGFAVEYKDLDPDLRHLVDDTAALVSVPSDS